VIATIILQDLADLEHYENLREAHLRWLKDTSVTEALSMFKTCTHLRRITLEGETKLPFPSSEELCDFIMKLKHLTCLHIIFYRPQPKCHHFKALLDEVNAFVLPRRPNFKLYISCCSECHEYRVPNEFFHH
jgi:hypothetical protein